MWICGSSGIAPNGSAPSANYCSQTPSELFTTANRIATGSYDAAGNQLSVAGSNLTYDAENRITTVSQPGIGTVTYTYDGNGRRVMKTSSSGSQTVYVYDAGGELVSEYSLGPGYAPPCRTCYLSLDHLGSTRLVTDQNGNTVSRHDYIPFGEEIPANMAGRDGTFGTQDFVNQKFTGKERDQESGLDYFAARYYGSARGRFTSPDPDNASGMVPDPQSWNAYAYGRNNPLLYTDPTGRNYTVCDQNGEDCADLTDQQWADFSDQNGIGQQAGGQLYVTNDNGSYTNVGTATWYDPTASQAVSSLNFLLGIFASNYGEVAGPLVGAALNDSRFIGLGLKGAAEDANALAKARNAIPLKDPDTVRRVKQALDDIANGTRRYSRDGIPFQNREGILPNEPPGYYKEYTVQPQTGITNRGTERLVVGQGGEVYYTPNHYGSFARIR